jgi:hypothetical protein
MYFRFGRKEDVSSSLLKQLEEQQHRLTVLESKASSVVLDMEDLRNKVLRKIQFKRDTEEEAEAKGKLNQNWIGNGLLPDTK